ncbi:MAG: hypothetical protein IJS97_01070 [Prevotella sp.]|nr:hypothetical protein [Prevotella sp.]
MPASAQNVTLKGVGHNNRYNDGEQMKSTYVGWNSELGKAVFIVDNGIYSMTTDGTSLSTPVKDPAVNIEDVRGKNEKEIWVSNFNMMYGNSGAAYIHGKLVTVMSHDESSTVDEQLFSVRTWDAKTGNLLSTQVRPKSDRLESAGMAYNPKDGKVYGLFYMTGQSLPEEITSDPDYFADQDDDMTDGDAGYCICTIDLSTMKVTPITPGLYYQNFVTFAINSEGRAFALTSGGGSAPEDADGKLRDINGNLVGANLFEFDLTTGLMKTKEVEAKDPQTGETFTETVSIFEHGTGYSSQPKRQAACFSKSNPNKMYWIGYYNSGKGYNEWGSWSSLSDKDWRTNHKYDTALYEVDITTGDATRVALVDNRWIFSALWVDGDDCSDDAEVDPFSHGSDKPVEGTYIALSHAENGSIWQQAEIGKQYTYYLEASEGWTLHSVTFNGTELDVTDNTVTTPAVGAAFSQLIVTFEQNGSSDARMMEAQKSQVKVLGTANGVHIANAAAGDVVSVFTADGKLVRSVKLNAQSADIALNARTLYIIRVGGKTVKVRL